MDYAVPLAIAIIAVIFIVRSIKVVPSSMHGSRSVWANMQARSRPA